MVLLLHIQAVMFESHPQFSIGSGQIIYSLHVFLSWSKIQIMILEYQAL